MIYLTGEFDSDLLDLLPQLYRPEPPTVLINSVGGDVDVLAAFLDVFEWHKDAGRTVTTYVSGVAASAGSMLACAGSKGSRYISPRSYHLVHYGAVELDVTTPESFVREYTHFQGGFAQVVNHYTRYAHIPDLTEALKSDSLYVYPTEALEWGLADQCGVPHF